MDFSYPSRLSAFEDYGTFGFDVDHCITRYQIKNLTQLMYDGCIENLQKMFNYPAEAFNSPNILNFGMGALAVDVENGNILKLGVGSVILRGYNGLDLLTDAEIKLFYGDKMTFEGLDPYDYNAEGKRYICISLFHHVWAILLAECVQFKKKSSLFASKPLEMLRKEIGEAYYRLWVFWDYKGEKHNMESFSILYREIIQKPEKYLYKQPELFEILKHLKKEGKFMFIASNSPYPFVKATLDYSLGEKWEDCFDLIIGNAGKPFFFMGEREFFEFDASKLKFRGETCKELGKCKILVEGNVKMLQEHINKSLGNQKRKVFFGDHLIIDNFYSSRNAQWDTVHLFEEMQEIKGGKMLGGLDYKDFWGDFFFEEKEDQKINTFWPDFVKKNCSESYPFLLCEGFKNFVKYK